ncbi:ParB/RepB/Spo0J family partition protein [Ligilactobacillus hohenheimensis]|uniref:ParB/RepB/Spo0J family partition protein n=1 Tax=Ligilactobacillus hohenheimensis TaxID=2991832 RepID=UPI0024BAB4F8|nr:ParB/RepB/Spo0J family partition protein [Ligilactobacillus hohenheimensis]
MAFSFFGKKHDEEDATVQDLPVAAITPNRYQPRHLFGDRDIYELAATIKEHGLLQPIIVRETDPEKYEIIAGERRFRAVKQLEWDHIPAIVKQMNDNEAASMAVIENLQREELSPIEEARAYHRLLELNKLTQSDLATALGKSQSFIANKLRLLRLSPLVQRAVMQRQLTERHGRCLVGLPEKDQVKLMNRIMHEHLSVEQTEQLVQQAREGQQPLKNVHLKNPAHETPEYHYQKTMKDIQRVIQRAGKDGMAIHSWEEDVVGYHRVIIDIPVADDQEGED